MDKPGVISLRDLIYLWLMHQANIDSRSTKAEQVWDIATKAAVNLVGEIAKLQ